MYVFSSRGTKAGLIVVAAMLAATAGQAQTKARPAPTVPLAAPVQPVVSSAEIVDRMLRPRASDPDVPLPRPYLTDKGPDRALSGPTIYGRSEDGGGVFGLKIPIPAIRGSAGSTTRYSSTN